MASWMVHLRIADAILNMIEGLDESAFVLGNIAPDSGVPNADWTAYEPPKSVSHFKTGDDFDLDLFRNRYFSKELIPTYDRRAYSFFLGYYVHLLSDVEWKNRIFLPNVSDEQAARTGQTLNELLWEHKADWYDLDFLYLEQHPDFRAFHIFENATDIRNDLMDIFAEDAFENRRGYICWFYHSDEHGDLHRTYQHLTPENADRFVSDTTKIVLERIRNL